jgi:hypothetical protein
MLESSGGRRSKVGVVWRAEVTLKPSEEKKLSVCLGLLL